MSHVSSAVLLNRLNGVYRDPGRISRDAISLINSPSGKNLRPSISLLAQNDGTFSSVMVFQGTVPMVYRSRQYHIPVDIFLPPLYPVRPPTCYVRPVSNMVIKENHRHVGRDGMVYMPYLHSWNANNSSLVEMTSALSTLFGYEPPLFTKRTNNAPAPAPPQYHEIDLEQHAETIALNESKQEEILRQKRLEQEAARKKKEEQTALQLLTARERKREEEIALQLLKEDATRKVQSHINSFFQKSRDWIASDLQDQNALSSSEKTITAQIENFDKLKSEFWSKNLEIDKKLELIQAAIKTKATNKDAVVSIDDLVTPCDINSSQMLQLSSENAALSDCLYFLDKALARGTISVSVHLKYVRWLAKRQFLVRAHCMKIAHCKKTVEV